MNARERANTWLKFLNDKKGEDFTFDDKNQCKIFYKDGIVCTLEVLEAEGKFYLYVPLTNIQPDSNTMRRALEANLFQIITAGAVIALDKNSNSFIVSFVGDVSNFDAETFFDRLCIFLASIVSIRDMLMAK